MLLWLWICAHAAPTTDLPAMPDVSHVEAVAVIVGDKPEFAEPDHDDSRAIMTRPGMFALRGVPVERVTWVRFTVGAGHSDQEGYEPAIGIDDPMDAATVYIDGEEVAQVGQLGWQRRYDAAVVPIPAAALEDGEAVVALRVVSDRADSVFGGQTGALQVGDGRLVASEMTHTRLREDLRRRGEQGGSLAMLALGVMFLLIGAWRWEATYSLFGAAAGVMGGVRLLLGAPTWMVRPPDRLILPVDALGQVLFVVFILRFCRIRRRWLVWGLPGLVLAGQLPFVVHHIPPFYDLYAAAGAFAVGASVLLLVHAAYRRVPDAWVMLVPAPLIFLGFLAPVLGFERGAAEPIRLASFVAAPVGMVGALASRLVRNQAAAARFVPRELLGAFGWSEVGEVVASQQVQAVRTVLFTDIRGFTRLSEKLGPHEVGRVADALLTLQADAIYGSGGFVDKYIGDAVMALFDEPADAVVAARRIRTDLERWNADRAVPVDIGIGIHTGPVVLGVIGSANRLSCTVMGDTVNVASRIEGLTKELGHSVLLTRATADAAGHVGLERVGKARVRGREGEVTVFGLAD